ncbi:MAG: hypothetical protein GON13_04010, partial [Nanoarchaeota archaeon]|nr:hypothetical protein [Nanoarchaeota archaeon]
MKILVVGDLHGKKIKIKNDNFDTILCVGDFCDDKLKKIIFEEIKEKQKNPKYNKRWYDIIGKENAKKEIQNSLKKGREVLEYLNSFNKPTFIVPGNWDFAKFEKSKWKYYQINHFKKILEGLKNIKNIHNKKIEFSNHTIIGYGKNWEPEIPDKNREKWYEQRVKDWMKNNYEKQTKINDTLFKIAKKPIIYLTHNSPHNTPLDKIN